MLMAGFLTVLFYSRRNPGQVITGRMGAKLGSVCGGIAFATVAIINSVAALTSSGAAQMRESILKAQQQYVEILQQIAVRNPNPQNQQLIDYFRSPDALPVFFAMWLFSLLVWCVLFATLGGVIGGVISRKQTRM